MQVELHCDSRGSVSHERADRFDVRTVFQQVGGEAVAQSVGLMFF